MRLPEGFLDSARSIIDQALLLPAEEREAFLDSNCRDDVELRQALRTLLEFSTIPPEVRTGGAGEFVLEPEFEEDLGVGARLGPYELKQVLGEGGMGTVFLAEQRQPLQRKVALKLVKLGMDTRAVVTRFEAERQTLARLDHPAIARVHDAGSTVRGRPYFVMEFIDGPPLTDYCDQNQLTLRERLELFVYVCRAVHHANHRGIIHRDIKPSNILVDTSVDPPLPKIIDFGIAKATEALSDGATLLTQQGQIVGTPHYMSPERIQGLDPPGVGWDVYSLGVVLYQLLCGLLPLELPEGRSLIELLKYLADSEPVAPSARFTRADTSIQHAVSDARSLSDPREVERQLRGDLDAIAMKAIDVDSARRYDSALQIAQDIERFLSGHTVQAQIPSRRYRLRKLILRHRALAGSLAAIVLLSLLSAAAMAVLWRQQVHERERAEDTREYLEDLIGSTTDRSVLDGASLTVGRRFASEPAVEAELRLLIGRAYRSLGILDEATSHVTAALEFLRKGEDSVLTAEVAAELGALMAARERYEEAISLYDESLSLRVGVYGPESPETLEPMLALANLTLEVGDKERASAVFDEMKRRIPSLSLDQRHFFGQSVANLANVRTIAGQPVVADSLYGTSVRLLLDATGGDSLRIPPDVVRQWGDLLVRIHENERAESRFLWAVRIYEAMGVTSGGMHALMLNSIGSVQTTMGKLESAEANLIEARDALAKSDPRSQNMSAVLLNLSLVRLEKEQFEDALESLVEAEEIAFEENDQIYGYWVRHWRGHCLARLGRAAEGVPLMVEGAEILNSRGALDKTDQAGVEQRLAAARESRQRSP